MSDKEDMYSAPEAGIPPHWQNLADQVPTPITDGIKHAINAIQMPDISTLAANLMRGRTPEIQGIGEAIEAIELGFRILEIKAVSLECALDKLYEQQKEKEQLPTGAESTD